MKILCIFLLAIISITIVPAPMSDLQVLQIHYLQSRNNSLQTVRHAWETISETISEEMQRSFEKATVIPRRYQTVASRRLDLEFDLYPVTKKHYAVVDVIIDVVAKELDARKHDRHWKKYSHKQRALITLQCINVAIRRTCYRTYKPQQLLSCAITEKKFDCHTLTTMYMAVGEALHLPIVAVSVPNHIFVRWNLPQERHVNWETTHGAAYPDSYYISKDVPAKKVVIYSIAQFPVSYASELYWAYNQAAKNSKDKEQSIFLAMKKFFVPQQQKSTY